MPARKPLVIVNGQPQQLPAGDTLDASVSEVDVSSLTNSLASSVPICTPVYISGSNACLPARANAAAAAEIAGLVRDASIGTGAAGIVQTDGILNATTAQWDAVTGGTGGLTPGAVYFLSASTAGRITTTAPTATGEYVARVGRAFSSTALDISIEVPILL